MELKYKDIIEIVNSNHDRLIAEEEEARKKAKLTKVLLTIRDAGFILIMLASAYLMICASV